MYHWLLFYDTSMTQMYHRNFVWQIKNVNYLYHLLTIFSSNRDRLDRSATFVKTVVMDERKPSAIIRKIQWGIIPGEPSFGINVGSTPVRSKKKDYIVSEIIEDRDTFLEYGYFEYLIYASPDGTTKDQFFWKRYNKRPDAIEHYFPDEVEEFLV